MVTWPHSLCQEHQVPRSGTSCLLGGCGRVPWGRPPPLQLGLWFYLTQTGALAGAAAPSFCVNEIPGETHRLRGRGPRPEGHARKATLAAGTELEAQGPPVLWSLGPTPARAIRLMQTQISGTASGVGKKEPAPGPCSGPGQPWAPGRCMNLRAYVVGLLLMSKANALT